MQLLESDEDVKIRNAAFCAICRIGPSEQEYAKLIDYLTGSAQEHLELADTWPNRVAWDRWSGTIETILSVPLPEPVLRQIVDLHLSAVIPDPRPEFRRYLAQVIRRNEAHDCVAIATEALNETDDAVVMRAVFLLTEVGDLAMTAAPALAGAFDITDMDLCKAILLALESVGDTEYALPVLVEALQHDSQFVRSDAAQVAGRIGNRSKELLSILREGMTDWEGLARPEAAFAVYKLDPTASEPLQVLEACLSPENEEGEEDIVSQLGKGTALSRLIEVGKPALPIIMNVLLKADLNQDQLEPLWLEHIYSSAKSINPELFTPALLKCLQSEDACLRRRGASLVARRPVGPENAPIIERLWECLLDEDEATQRYCAWALKAIVDQHDSTVEEGVN